MKQKSISKKSCSLRQNDGWLDDAARTYILTATLDSTSHQRLTELRTRYFPPAINFLEAHITLFHALPGAIRDNWEPKLMARARAFCASPIHFTHVYSLGRGVAIRAECPALTQLRDDLARDWSSFLSAQDRQKWKPHCTIQNKVSPDSAKKTLIELSAHWQPFQGAVTGVSLWIYKGGPWRKIEFRW